MFSNIQVHEIEPYNIEKHEDYNKYLEYIKKMNEKESESTKTFNEAVESFPEKHIEMNNQLGPWKLQSNVVGMTFIEVSYIGKLLRFFIDTGAMVSCIHEKHLHDYEEVEIPVGDSAGQFSLMSLTSLKEMSLLNVTLTNWPVLVLKGEQMSMKILSSLLDFDGIIGWDILRNIDFAIDFKLNELEIVTDHMIGEKNLIPSDFPSALVMDESDGLHVFGIDTGARSSWLNHRVIKRLDLKVHKKIKKKYMTVHGVTYQWVQVIKNFKLSLFDKRITYNKIKTGETGLLNDSEFDGLLGFDIMKNNKVYFISSQNIFKID